jgi:hypothetical protein
MNELITAASDAFVIEVRAARGEDTTQCSV